MSPIHNRRRARGGLPGAWNPYTDRINYSLEHSGTTLRLVSVSDSIFCTVSSFDDGICIESHASEKVNEIKDAIDKLKECRKAESDPEEKRRIKDTIKYLKKVLRDVGHAKRVGKTVGSHVGSKAGAAVGTCIAGPVGTAAGSVIGRIVGRVTGALAADDLARHTREESAETTVKRLY
ncbi:uncharacterized protein LOC117242706 [Bombus vosnesenskii]|uniref:Uncharacterized protein LOC117242706 n=2 Tax=Pyrobombus TaxID=144703 RepID=A0A6J3LJB3_9HYME|nr:uncharacterized protein LOC117156405 [Bombus vancouverensis nearcticus]XP_033316608.1 uncharacterized protein LOC117214536 [Bombus bifarius]XP_033365482.1 uncharacterized protein LOC117242706 [Bombus vosnesenskii]XP_050476809.1 uncharacterized protein LOC126866862 [Bombus huntii]